MSNTPSWLAATPGQPAQAGQINQFLGSHSSQILYNGNITDQQATAGSGSVSSQSTWLGQRFVTGASQTSIGYVALDMQVTVSSGVNPIIVSIYQDSGSLLPVGPALASNVFTIEYCSFSHTWTYLPMPVTGLTAGAHYWLVTQPVGTSSTNSYPWMKSNQTSGAATSSDGVTWTAQSYGFMYQIVDQGVTGSQVGTYDDSGARWTWKYYNTDGTIQRFYEYTAGQGSNQYVQSTRQLNYTNGQLVTVT